MAAKRKEKKSDRVRIEWEGYTRDMTAVGPNGIKLRVKFVVPPRDLASGEWHLYVNGLFRSSHARAEVAKARGVAIANQHITPVRRLAHA